LIKNLCRRNRSRANHGGVGRFGQRPPSLKGLEIHNNANTWLNDALTVVKEFSQVLAWVVGVNNRTSGGRIPLHINEF
jgi:hypothetical protein